MSCPQRLRRNGRSCARLHSCIRLCSCRRLGFATHALCDSRHETAVGPLLRKLATKEEEFHLPIIRALGVLGPGPPRVAAQADGERIVEDVEHQADHQSGLGPLRAWLDRFWDRALAAYQAEVESNPEQ